jgi:hypothetical protein
MNMQKRQAYEEASRATWLTEIESKILSYIHRHQDKHGTFPMLTCIQRDLELSEYKVRHTVLSLAKKQFISYKVRRWG